MRRALKPLLAIMDDEEFEEKMSALLQDLSLGLWKRHYTTVRLLGFHLVFDFFFFFFLLKKIIKK